MVNIKKNHDLGLLLLRIAIGAVFIAHGWGKFAQMDGTIAFFATIGFPAIIAYLVAAVELLGGVALVIGLWTDLVTLLFSIVMVVAIVYVKMGKFGLGFVDGYEFDLVLLAGSLPVMFVGPGKYTALKGKM